MKTVAESLSVLVVDQEPEVLSFFARVLDNDGIRALLARNSSEAIGIARRGYVPIDVVVSNVLLRPDSAFPDVTGAPDLIDRLRELRPNLRPLYMSAWLDDDVIRIELIDRGLHHMSKNSDHRGLIEAIRGAAGRKPGQLVRTMGGH